MSTRVKICGITRAADAEAAIAAGADAIGLVFVPASPRRVTREQAASIARAVAGRICRVGLFVDASVSDVEATLAEVPLDVLQFHGDESGAYCRSFGVPYLKAIRVRDVLDIAAIEAEYGDACALLLDAWVAGQHGGTGQSFDWSLWPAAGQLPCILAGGLDPDNVAAAVRRVAPWAVDVSGGIEGARKGEKDAERIQRFIAEVRRAGSE